MTAPADRILLITAVISILAASSCQPRRGSYDLEYLRKRLADSPSSDEHVRDYELLRRAVKTDIRELAQLEGDVVEAIERDGLIPIISFLIHYMERMYSAQPTGWERRVARLKIKAQPYLPVTKSSGKARTIGVISYAPPLSIKHFSLRMANFFFCQADTEPGQSSLLTGGGAQEIMSLGVIFGEYCETSSDDVGNDNARKRALLCQDFMRPCAGENEESDEGFLGYSYGLRDAYTSCVMAEQGDSVESLRKKAEVIERCNQYEKATNPIASYERKHTPTPQELRQRKLERAYDKERRARADVRNAADREFEKLAEVLNKEHEIDEKQKNNPDQPVNPKDVADLEQKKKDQEAASKAHDDAQKAWEAAKKELAKEKKKYDEEKGEDEPSAEDYLKNKKKKDNDTKSGIENGRLPYECLNEGAKKRWNEFHGTMHPDGTPGEPGPIDCTVAYVTDDSCSDSRLGACDEMLFAMTDSMTNCAGVESRMCTLMDPPPEDPCDCFLTADETEGAATKLQDELEKMMTKPIDCTVASCAEGYECAEDGCLPEIVNVPLWGPEPGPIDFGGPPQ